MQTETYIQAGSEKQAYSSVEVSRNSRGYTWSVKLYCPIGEEDGLLPKIEEMEGLLRAKFGAEVKDEAE